VIIGYAVDAGVRRNKGRAGASEGPTSLRRACSNLPCPAQPILLADGGDVFAQGDDVLGAQHELARRVAMAQSRGARTLVFGGGHDVAFGHWLGLATRDGASPMPGVTASVNFDAHLDNRPVPAEGPNSGTSYSQVHAWCAASNVPFLALALGIQRAGNTSALFDRAKDQGYAWKGPAAVAPERIDASIAAISRLERVHLTVDLDCFAAAYAPGVSAPTPLGVGPEAAESIRRLIMSCAVRGVDLAELAPALDADGRTARLAAAIAFDIVDAWSTPR
jgi:formiminoglutamase